MLMIPFLLAFVLGYLTGMVVDAIYQAARFYRVRVGNAIILSLSLMVANIGNLIWFLYLWNHIN